MSPRTVQAPPAFADLFDHAEATLSSWLAQRLQEPGRARIAHGDERYLEVRAASLSVEFFDLVRAHYGGDRDPEADDVARALLYDISQALARVDAASLAEQVGVTDPLQQLAFGPVHFAMTGWARVELHDASLPVPTDDYVLVYDHHHSFEAEAWLRLNRRSEVPVCIMSAGYSSGWCSRCFDLELVAAEVLCIARGDPCCRFVMAPPHRLAEHVAALKQSHPELADRMHAVAVPGFLGRRGDDAQLRWEHTAQLQVAFEHANTGMAIVSTEGHYLLCNPAYAAMLKMGPADLEGQRIGFALRADLGSEQADELRATLEGERDQFRFEVEADAADGSVVHIDVAGSLMRDATGRELFYVLQAQDLTEQRTAQRQLARAQKMQAAQELAGGLAHDLNNLLTVILGAADQLEMTLGADHRGSAAVDAIQRAASRAGTVTQQLLSFSRKQVVEARVHDVPSVIAEIDDLLRRVLGERIQLHIAAEPEVSPVRIDAGQLEQVLVNLTVNARHAMPVGGELTVHVRNEGSEVVLEVVDTGTGMSPEVLEQALEPFFTTRPEGTGLGLAVVQGIVTQAGGRLDIVSDEEEGTTVWVRLPAVDDTPVVLPPRHPALGPEEGGAEVVLLAEDDDEIRSMLTEVLESLGYATLTASDGEEAVAIGLDAHHIDLLLTDVVMPGLAGPEVADYLRERHPGLQVLFMSGYADAELEPHSLPDDARVLRKPFALRTMAARVRDVLDD